MSQVRELLRAVGEGALAGCAAAGVFGTWELVVSQNVSHGLLRLAVERMAAAITAGALIGVTASGLLHLLLDRLGRRGRRSHRIGAALIAAGYVIGIILVAIPLRDTFFRLRVFSTRSAWVAVLLAQSAIGGLLLWRLFRGTSPSDPPARPGRGALGAAYAGAVLVLAGALTLIATPRLPLAAGATGRPVILVSLDTLRADRVGILGNPRGLTPHLDGLAGEGAVFEQAHSTAPWTLPSHASVFTSLLPYDHGCRFDHNAIRPRNVTLAERFRNAGYRTAAFTGGCFVAKYFGFGQGFEVYEEHDEAREGGPERIAGAALRWIRDHREEPFFVFVHTYEVHVPFRRGTQVDSRDAGRLPAVFGKTELEAVRDGSLVLTPAERRYVADLYDGGVAHADQVVGGLLETLRREGVLDRAVLMVISDHGEELWEHSPNRSPGHGHSLYQEIQHVPWLVRAPGIVPAGLRLRGPVSLLDLAPTLEDLTGLPAGAAQQGTSLAGALRKGEEPAGSMIMMESVEFGPERFALRVGDLKVILTPFPEIMNSGVSLIVPPLQVFDLAEDPGERDDLSGRMEDTTRRMTEKLYVRVREVIRSVHARPIEADMSADLRRQLESLGYVH